MSGPPIIFFTTSICASLLNCVLSQSIMVSVFEQRERPNDETAEDSKTTNKKKAVF